MGGRIVDGEGVEQLVARDQRLLEAPLAAVKLRQPRPRLHDHATRATHKGTPRFLHLQPY